MVLSFNLQSKWNPSVIMSFISSMYLLWLSMCVALRKHHSLNLISISAVWPPSWSLITWIHKQSEDSVTDPKSVSHKVGQNFYSKSLVSGYVVNNYPPTPRIITSVYLMKSCKFDLSISAEFQTLQVHAKWIQMLLRFSSFSCIFEPYNFISSADPYAFFTQC